MFELSEIIKKKVEEAVALALKTNQTEVLLEGGFFITTIKEQPEGVGFFNQIEEGGKTFYVCQKMI